MFFPSPDTAIPLPVPSLSKDALYQIWFEGKPSACDPKSRSEHPSMWFTWTDGDLTLFTRPGRTMTRPAMLAPYIEVDGVHYAWQRDGQWVGPGYQATFAEFAHEGPSRFAVPPRIIGFDWSTRLSFPVLTLPFTEGPPSPDAAADMTRWIKRHADLYANNYVKMYHGTCAQLPIETEGLKPTSPTRRRSYQSTSGYVYLANTPERAQAFGALGNGGHCVVYEVVVLVRDLLADRDQLTNQRAAGHTIGNSIGESIVYGGGARVKGAIAPWAVRRVETTLHSAPREGV